MALYELESARGRIANSGLVPGQTKRTGERSQRVGFVVDNQQTRFCGHRVPPFPYEWAPIDTGVVKAPEDAGGEAGRSMVNIVPLSGSLFTEIFPPWSLTTD